MTTADAFEYGWITLHEGMLTNGLDPPVVGNSGYFKLKETDKLVTLFHVATLSKIDVRRNGIYVGKNFKTEWNFAERWLARPIDRAATAMRLRFWADSYDSNGKDFNGEIVKKLLAWLGEPIDDAKPKTHARDIERKAAAIEAARDDMPAAAQPVEPPVAPARASSREAGTTRGPGVIDTIVEAVGTDWTSLDVVLKRLVERFPSRDAAGMEKTLFTQLRSMLPARRGLTYEIDRVGKRARRIT